MRGKAMILALGVCVAVPAHADFYDGWRAYDSGDVARAAAEWRAAAAKGDARSQFRLGELYENGRGVERDPVLALMWYSIAAKAGYTEAGLAGSLLAANMTPKQTRRARRLASRWPARANLGAAATPSAKTRRKPTRPRTAMTSTPDTTLSGPLPEIARRESTNVEPIRPANGEWSGVVIGKGICASWRMPIKLRVSDRRLSGTLDAGHVHCSFAGPIDAAGNGRALGRCNAHTSVIVMTKVGQGRVEGSIAADAVNCSGKFALQPAAAGARRRANRFWRQSDPRH